MKAYAISGWDERFETSETRKLQNLQWWPKPNKHDGLGFRRLASNRERVELYCAWALIGDIASRTPRPNRGILVRNGNALTADDLSVMTGFSSTIFVKAFEFFSDPQQGWLIQREVETQSEPYRVPAPAHNGVERIPQASSPTAPADSPSLPGDHPGGIERIDEKVPKGSERTNRTNEKGRERGSINAEDRAPVRSVPERGFEERAKAFGLASDCLEVLGDREMCKNGARWTRRAVEDSERLLRVLNEVCEMERLGRVKTTKAQVAEDLWKRFK